MQFGPALALSLGQFFLLIRGKNNALPLIKAKLAWEQG